MLKLTASRAFILICYGLILWAANRPYVYLETNADRRGRCPDELVRTTGGYVRVQGFKLKQAGWPFPIVRTDTFDGLEPRTQIVWSNACIVVVFWLALLYVAIRLSRWTLKQSETNSPIQKANLSDLLIIITTVCGFAAIFNNGLFAEREINRLADDIAEHGGEVRLTTLQAPFVFSMRTNLKVSEIRVVDPPSDLMQRIAELDFLRVLHVSGSSNPSELLDAIPNVLGFSDLTLRAMKLDTQSLERLKKHESLHSLSLLASDIESLAPLNDFTQLRQLNLAGSTVELEDFLANSSLKENIRILQLPPQSELSVADWKRLVELHVHDSSSKFGLKSKLSVMDCYNLHKLVLDPACKFDLTLNKLPSLRDVGSSTADEQAAFSLGKEIPAHPWLTKIDFRALPALKELTVHVADLEAVEMHELQLSLTLSTMREKARVNSNSMQYTSGIVDLENLKAVISDLAMCKGLWRLNAASNHFGNVDLTPLLENASLRSLALGGASTANLLGTQGKSRLVALTVGGDFECTMQDVINAFPTLQQLQCGGFTTDDLSLVGPSPLRSFTSHRGLAVSQSGMSWSSSARYGEGWRGARFEIIDMPALQESYIAQVSADSVVRVRNAPSLSGLSFFGDLPANAEVRGLRALKVFAVTGSGCTPEILSEVLNCRRLEELTIGPAKFDFDAAVRITQLPHLRKLALRDVQFSNTPQDRPLSLPQTLSSLRLEGMHWPFNLAAGKYPSVTELALIDMDLDSELLLDIAKKFPNARQLDLSRSIISAEAIEGIVHFSILNVLNLCGCTFSVDFTDSLIKRLSGKSKTFTLQLDLDDAEIKTRLLNELPDITFYYQ